TVYAAWGKEFWQFPRFYYLVSINAWLVALGVAVWLTLRRGWLAGGGLTLAICVGGIISSWWYFMSVQELQIKAAGDFAQHNSSALAVYVLSQSLATCYWLIPLFFVAGLAYGLCRRELRLQTILGLSLIAPAFVFYSCSNVPIGSRYLLPSTAAVLVIAFAWLGRFPKVCACFMPLLLLVSALQLEGYRLPKQWLHSDWLEVLRVDAPKSAAVRVPPPPDSDAPPIAELTSYILHQLDCTGESRFTAVISPDARLDVDMLMLEAMLQGRLIDIEHYLPGRTYSVPKTSMVLAVEGDQPIDIKAEGEWGSEYELVKTWNEAHWGNWLLYKHPYNIDMRPLPGVTSGPPRNSATVK
ncbi:hypothetical protein IJT17_03220, partial [bacterium]|nr:hypothetical protein [bacterium]